MYDWDAHIIRWDVGDGVAFLLISKIVNEDTTVKDDHVVIKEPI